MNNPDLLPRILAHYAIPVVQHEHLRTSENVVMRLQAGDGTSYALRIRRVVGAYREQIDSVGCFVKRAAIGVRDAPSFDVGQ